MSIQRKENALSLIGLGVAMLGALITGTAHSVPVDVIGTILSPTQRTQVISALGVTATLPADTEVIGFDIGLASNLLGQNPLIFRMFDDGVPASGPDVSGGPFTGIDVDAVGGLNSGGSPTFASAVTFVQFGPEITPANNTLGQFHDPSVDGLFGDSAAEGFPANVLGPADAPVSFSLNINDFVNFTSIGSGGILELSFAGGIADADVVDNFDLFLFEVGAARDNGFFQVDVESIASVPLPATVSLIALGLAMVRTQRRRARAA